jgi:hypothetical protein
VAWKKNIHIINISKRLIVLQEKALAKISRLLCQKCKYSKGACTKHVPVYRDGFTQGGGKFHWAFKFKNFNYLYKSRCKSCELLWAFKDTLLYKTHDSSLDSQWLIRGRGISGFLQTLGICTVYAFRRRRGSKVS